MGRRKWEENDELAAPRPIGVGAPKAAGKPRIDHLEYLKNLEQKVKLQKQLKEAQLSESQKEKLKREQGFSTYFSGANEGRSRKKGKDNFEDDSSMPNSEQTEQEYDADPADLLNNYFASVRGDRLGNHEASAGVGVAAEYSEDSSEDEDRLKRRVVHPRPEQAPSHVPHVYYRNDSTVSSRRSRRSNWLQKSVQIKTEHGDQVRVLPRWADADGGCEKAELSEEHSDECEEECRHENHISEEQDIKNISSKYEEDYAVEDSPDDSAAFGTVNTDIASAVAAAVADMKVGEDEVASEVETEDPAEEVDEVEEQIEDDSGDVYQSCKDIIPPSPAGEVEEDKDEDASTPRNDILSDPYAGYVTPKKSPREPSTSLPSRNSPGRRIITPVSKSNGEAGEALSPPVHAKLPAWLKKKNVFSEQEAPLTPNCSSPPRAPSPRVPTPPTQQRSTPPRMVAPTNPPVVYSDLRQPEVNVQRQKIKAAIQEARRKVKEERRRWADPSENTAVIENARGGKVLEHLRKIDCDENTMPRGVIPHSNPRALVNEPPSVPLREARRQHAEEFGRQSLGHIMAGAKKAPISRKVDARRNASNGDFMNWGPEDVH